MILVIVGPYSILMVLRAGPETMPGVAFSAHNGLLADLR